jgi:hypothetical protein
MGIRTDVSLNLSSRQQAMYPHVNFKGDFVAFNNMKFPGTPPETSICVVLKTVLFTLLYKIFRLLSVITLHTEDRQKLIFI